jgi:HK97 family phage major capsid protein
VTEEEKKIAAELAQKLIAEHRAAAPAQPKQAVKLDRSWAGSAKPQFAAQKNRSFESIAKKQSDLVEQVPAALGALVRGARARSSQAAVHAAEKRGLDSVFTRAMSESIMADGGAFVPEVISDMVIEFLYPKSIVLQALPTRQQTSTGSLTFAKITDRATSNWVGENQAPVVSQPKTGQVRADLKKIMGLCEISNDLFSDSPSSAEQLIRDHLLGGIATDIDRALLSGVGSVFSPRGLTSHCLAANKVTSTGTTPAQIRADMTSVITKVKNANVPMTRPVWIMGFTAEEFLYNLQDVNNSPIYQAEMDRSGTIRGARVLTSSHVPAQTVIYCDMSQMIFVEGTGALGSQLSSSSEAGQAYANDQTVMRLISRLDFVPMRDGAEIALIQAATWA